MFGPPPRDFFCDARNVGAEPTSLERAARGEAVRRTARVSRSDALVLDHCSTKRTTFSEIGTLTKRSFVSGAPNPPPARSDEAEDDKTGTMREEPMTPSRRAPHEVHR